MKRLLLLLLISTASLFCQVNGPHSLVFVVVDPSGACVSGQAMQWNYVSGNFWGCSGSVWGLVSGTSSGGGGAGTSVRTSCLTVDGTTDNTACMQAAINTLNTAGGGTLIFPPGTYRGSFTLPDSGGGNCVNIIGAGQVVTTIKANAVGTAVISKAHVTKPLHCTISDITIDGNLQATDGILLELAKGWTIERVQIKRVLATTGKGMVLGYAGSSGSVAYESRISNVTCEGDSTDYITAPTMPLYCISFLAGGTDNLVSKLISRDFQIGVEDISGGSNFITDSHFYGFPIDTYSPTYGIESAGQIYVKGNNFDGFVTAGVHLTGNFVSLIANKFSQPSGSTITTAFPVLAAAGVDYVNFSDNITQNLGSIAISGVTTPISWNADYHPSSNSNVLGYLGLSSPNYFPPKGAYAFGQVSPVGTLTIGPVYNAQPQVTIKSSGSHTGSQLVGQNISGTTSYSFEDAGNLSVLGGATTGGNFGVVAVPYVTPSAVTGAAISAVTMATPGSNGWPSPGLYRFSAYLVQTAIGSGGTCNTNSEVSVQVAWKDGATGNAITNTNSASVNPFARTVGNGAINFLTLSNTNTTNTSSQGSVYPFVFYAQSGTAITYTTTMVVTDNCTTHATYQIVPLLEAF